MSIISPTATRAAVLLTVAVEVLKLGHLVVRPLDAGGQALGADLPMSVCTSPTAFPPRVDRDRFRRGGRRG